MILLKQVHLRYHERSIASGVLDLQSHLVLSLLSVVSRASDGIGMKAAGWCDMLDIGTGRGRR